MKQLFAALALSCLLAAGGVARCADPAPEADKAAAYLGVLFGPVSDALHDQLPQLPADQGVLVTQVLADSPAEKAGLRRNDILLQYADKQIRSCEELVRFLQADRPERTVELKLLRGGKELAVKASLDRGPAIWTALEAKSAGAGDIAPGVAKPGGPATVSVAAKPLGGGRMRVTIELHPEGQGRLKTVTCEGQPDEIASQVQKEEFSERERSMVEVALKRIHMLNAGKDAEKAPPPGTP